ncbi:MAG: hypothetical protein AAGC85_20895, partial [Bacteroidota bacterium]
MIKFVREYRSLFIHMAILVVLGIIFAPLSNMYLVILGLSWLQKRKDKELFILFLLILTLGDSRLMMLQFIKGLRPILLIILTIRTVGLVSFGKIKLDLSYFMLLPFLFIALLGVFRSPVVVASLTRMFSYAFFIFMVLHYLPYLMERYGKQMLIDILRSGMLILALGLIFIV